MRKKRPDVVVIEGLKMPRASRPSAENAKYCSLFFRPWTLLSGNMDIPHLSLLGLSLQNLEVYYSRTAHLNSVTDHEQKMQLPLVQIVEWSRAWDVYVRGNVVSQAAASLIRSFLLKTIAASGKQFNDFVRITWVSRIGRQSIMPQIVF